MKLSRRKMFGAAVGGVVAGPTIAKEAINHGAQLMQMGAGASPPTFNYEAKAIQAETKLNHETLARLKRIAAGDIHDRDRNYATEGPPPEPYRTLRSVSDEAKVFLRGRLYERRWRERTIQQAKDALDEYDKTGLLRHVLF